MSRFDTRSTQTELIDNPGIPFNDWATCLKELDSVNTWLGGHSITLEGVKKLLPAHRMNATIAEIGCGGGDNLKAIYRKYKSADTRFVGIDINEACTNFAEQNCREIPQVRFICSDYRLADFGDEKPDIIFNSLFCHHFTNNELVYMLKWMKANSRLGFFINDLQRHPVAWHSIRLLTSLFSRSYLVKNDGPVSVLRGFHKDEWKQLFAEAGIDNYTITWKWAFRYLIIFSHDHQ